MAGENAAAADDSQPQEGQQQQQPKPAAAQQPAAKPQVSERWRWAANQQQPGAQAEPPAGGEDVAEREEAGVSATPHTLTLPPELPASLAESWRPMLGDFSKAAAQAGISQTTAQMYIEAFADAETLPGMNADAIEGHGFPDSPEAARGRCETILRNFWGDKYEANLSAVRRAVKSAGPALGRFLDETGFGNRPTVLVALSMSGDLRLTPEQAKAELDKLNRSKDLLSGNKMLSMRRAVLGRIAYSDDADTVERTDPVSKTRSEMADKASKETARAQVAAMLNDKAHPLNDPHAPGHAAAVQQWHELVARIK